jgi:hypothetical protein
VAPVTLDPFADVADIDWASLQHAYGAADDVPEMLRDLASADPARRELGMDVLWGSVHHQGDVYDSTVAVIPLLIRAALLPEFPERVGVIEVLASIAENWQPGMYSRDEEHADWAGHAARAHAIIAAAVESFLPLLHDANADVRRVVAEMLAYFPGERALIFPAVRDALARSAAATGLEPPGPGEISALIDAGTGFAAREEATGAVVDEWLVSLWQGSTDPTERLAVISRIAGRGQAAFPGDLVQTVSALVDEVYARAPETEPAAELPDPPPIRTSLVATLRAKNQKVNLGQRAPWVGVLLDDIHRALDTRVAERTALALHELRAPEWERRYHGTRAANRVISQYRGDHAELVRRIGEQLAHPEQRVREMAELGLRTLGEDAAPALDSLLARVAQGPDAWSDHNGVSDSVYVLARLRDPRVLPIVRWHVGVWRPKMPNPILSLRKKPEVPLRPPSSLGRTLSALGPLAAEFIPLLLDLLKIPGPERGYDERNMHIATLGALGPQAASAVPALLFALDDPTLAESAAKALATIAPDAPKVRAAFSRIVDQEKPGCITAARTLATTHPSTELASLLLRHLDDDGRAGLEAANALHLFAQHQIHLTPEIRLQATRAENSWSRLIAAIALHEAENDVTTATAALTWAWDANPSIRAEVARYLPKLGEPAQTEFTTRLDAELADPKRHGSRQFPTGASTDTITDDEELLRLCRLARGSA